MARFTVRVELHDAEWSDYEQLHESMEVEGFSRLISSGDGRAYHLPWAEYNRETTLDKSSVLESAKRAAAQTGHKYSILVTESAGRTWHNLVSA